MNNKKYLSLAKFYNKNERYLFLGNSINQLHNGAMTWKGLLEKVKNEAKIVIDLDDRKSNTLLFEEMAFAIENGKGPIEDNIHQLKVMLAKNAIDLEPHQQIIDLVNCGHYQHYMTTNYDYCIEKCMVSGYNGINGKANKRPKYSMNRYNLVGKSKVWHLHGECNNGYNGSIASYPEASILIGFEHYSDYLEKVHRMVKDDTGKGLGELMDKAKENWVHLFFSRDIDIMGFGMDYAENHLWFLLNFRARLLRKRASIRNSIRWIIPEFGKEKNRDKIQILTALDVKVIYVKAAPGDYEGFYKEFTHNHSKYK